MHLSNIINVSENKNKIRSYIVFIVFFKGRLVILNETHSYATVNKTEIAYKIISQQMDSCQVYLEINIL